MRLAIACYLMGLLCFYTFAAFDQPVWPIAYWGWDKLCGGSVLLWYVLYEKTKEKHLVKPVLIFSLIRFLWEIISYFTELTANNEKGVAILFIVVVLTCIYLLIKDLLKWRKERL